MIGFYSTYRQNIKPTSSECAWTPCTWTTPRIRMHAHDKAIPGALPESPKGGTKVVGFTWILGRRRDNSRRTEHVRNASLWPSDALDDDEPWCFAGQQQGPRRLTSCAAPVCLGVFLLLLFIGLSSRRRGGQRPSPCHRLRIRFLRRGTTVIFGRLIFGCLRSVVPGRR